VIIDGEIVAIDEKGRPSFQLLQGFDMWQERPPIVFYAFDLLWLNGKNLQNLPIELHCEVKLDCFFGR
jgi:bifunctional non-homologous end joining protein LigD